MPAILPDLADLKLLCTLFKIHRLLLSFPPVIFGYYKNHPSPAGKSQLNYPAAPRGITRLYSAMPRVSSPTPVSYGLTQLMLKVMKDFPLIKRGIWSDPEGTRVYF